MMLTAADCKLYRNACVSLAPAREGCTRVCVVCGMWCASPRPPDTPRTWQAQPKQRLSGVVDLRHTPKGHRDRWVQCRKRRRGGGNGNANQAAGGRQCQRRAA